MEASAVEEAEKLYGRALESLAAGETPSALALLERALKLDDNPCWYSYLGYCIAKERGQVKKGCDLCGVSLEREPDNPVHYLNLAKVQLVGGNKLQAIQALRDGMSHGGSPGIASLLDQIGNRKAPVFSFLERTNPVNRYLGLVLDRLKLR
jgi:predicted Zn-dependent protease